MARPQPTPEILRKLLRYEPETGKLFWRKRPVKMFTEDCYAKMWNTRFANKAAFTSVEGFGYRQGTFLGERYLAHRAIWAMVHDEWPAEQIDHINGDPSDNRINNLRSVSCAENGRNKKRPSTNTSGVTGVRWDKAAGKWHSQIKRDGHSIHLGFFTDFSEAAAARRAAEAQYGFHENHGRL